MTFVPQPVLDCIQVEVKSDGRFGVEDSIQWPQLFSAEYLHYPLILRRPSDPNDHRQAIWWNPTRRNFILIHGSAVSFLGTLAAEPRLRLEQLVRQKCLDIESFCNRRGGPPTHINFCELSMRAAMSCLSFPSTYRDLVVQVTNVQQYWLESEAFLEYLNIYKPKFLLPRTTLTSAEPASERFMGTYTADPIVAFKLFTAGIPVWLVQSPHVITSEISMKEIVSLSRPSNIKVGHQDFGQVVYVGQVGAHHHTAVNRGGHTYMDIPKVFLSKNNQIRPTAGTSHISNMNMISSQLTSSSGQASGSQASYSKQVAKASIRANHAPCMSFLN